MKETVKERGLTLKAMQKHLIMTVVTALCLAVLGGVLSSFAFYHNTKNDIKVIQDNDIEQNEDIQNIHSTLKEINNKLGTTNTTTAVSDEKIKGLENTVNNIKEDMGRVQENQTEILKILGEIKRKQ